MSVPDHLESQDSDDDIQVLACYHENAPFPPQLAAGRAMTTELTNSLNDLNLPKEDFTDTISTFTEPSQELLDWCVGAPPTTYVTVMAEITQSLNAVSSTQFAIRLGHNHWKIRDPSMITAANCHKPTNRTHGIGVHTSLDWASVLVAPVGSPTRYSTVGAWSAGNHSRTFGQKSLLDIWSRHMCPVRPTNKGLHVVMLSKLV